MCLLALVVAGAAAPGPVRPANRSSTSVPATSAPTSPSKTAVGGVPPVSGAKAEHPRIAAAIRDYRALRIERVIDPLEDLLFDGALDDQARARALYLLGLAYAQTGESETARERLTAACTIDPGVDVDVPVPRKLKSLVQAARDAGARAHAAARPPPSPVSSTSAVPTGATTDATTGGTRAGDGLATSPATKLGPSSSAGAAVGPWPWIVTGVGGAALVGSGVAAGFGWSLAEESAAASTTQREAVRLADDANATFVVAGVAAGIGLGVGAAGLAWSLLSSSP
jgi:hypothetical protein